MDIELLMKLTSFAKTLKAASRWTAATLLCLFVLTGLVQGPLSLDTTAIAATQSALLASANLGDQVQDKVSDDTKQTKNFIQDTANKVEKTAKKNASKVGDAMDGSGSFVERKAKKDAATIERRAEEDAARTQKAVDDTKNVVERAADSIKDVFGG